MINISAPPSSGREDTPPPPVDHDPSGSRVSVEKFNQVYGPSGDAPSTEETKEETASSIAAITEVQKELTSVTSGKIDVALQQAHATMRATLDETFLKDLEKLSEAELRIHSSASIRNGRADQVGGCEAQRIFGNEGKGGIREVSNFFICEQQYKLATSKKIKR